MFVKDISMKKLIITLITVLTIQDSFSQNGFCLTIPQVPSFGLRDGSALAKGDFNNDGLTDICTQSAQASTVSLSYGIGIFLSNGNGTFTGLNTVTLTLNGPVINTQVSDFNNDGNQDIIAICNNTNDLFILLGTGTGSFNAINIISLNSVPVSLSTADFNNDSKTDVAIANGTLNSVSILLGAGTGSFSGAVNYTVGSNPTLLVPGDFNNNAATDLFVLSGGTGYFLKGNGNGTFTVATSMGISASDIISLDVNSDNKVDLVYSDISNSKIVVLKGNGNFTFSAALNYSVSNLGGAFSFGRVSSGDFNNDGKIDLVTSSSYSLNILPGTGTGTFLSPLSYTLPASIYDQIFNLIIADINNDTKPDIFVLVTDAPTPFAESRLFLNCNTVDIVERDKKELLFKLYPNPAQNILQLTLSPGNEFTYFVIYDCSGKKIKEEDILSTDIENKTVRIKTDDLSEGMYSLHLKNENNETASKKFIIHR